MALNSPTITEITNRIIADINAEYGQKIPILAKAVFRVWAFIQAGIFIILYKFGTSQFRQRFVQTANETFLALLGEQVGVNRTPAQIWTGTCSVGVSAIGGVLQAGIQLINNSSGVVYIVNPSKVIALTPVETFTLESTVSGDISNLVVGDELTFVNPQAGLTDPVTVTIVSQEGADQEPLEQYRQRVLDRYQKQPQGGALADYELWSEEAPNVINAYPYAGTTTGTVDVFIEVDNQTDGIPTSSQLIIALDYINFDPVTGKATRRPTTAEVATLAIYRTTFTVKVQGLSPDTPDIRTAIDNAVAALYLEKEPFIKGLSIIRKDTITTAEVASIISLVAASNGAIVNTVITEESGIPFDLRTLGKGEKAKVTTPLTYT
jgi:uncharacterized phage protein gp47/JayE